jgi:hypothetical protein
MSSLGDDFTEGDQPAAARLNRRTYMRIDGDAINAYSNVGDTKLFYAVSDDGGLVKDNLYSRSADDQQILNMTQNKHTHGTDTDVDGGSLLNVFGENMNLYELNLETPTTYDFFVESTDASSVPQDQLANAQTYINLRTTAATNSFSNIMKGGAQLSFTDSIWCNMILQVSHNTSILWRAGINMVRANQTDSGTQKEFGIESCSGQADPSKIMIITSNGAGVRTATATNSLVIPATNAFRGFKLAYETAAKVLYTDSDGNTNTITTNVPTSGNTTGDGAFRASVKTTTTAVRNLFVAGVKVKGKLGGLLA